MLSFKMVTTKLCILVQMDLVLVALVCMPVVTSAQSPAPAFDHEHRLWDQLVATHVVDTGPASQVRYQAIKQNPKDLLQYLADLSAVSPMQYETWNKVQQLAFLINAYNAFTVKLIIDHYPVESIKDIGGWFGNPWKKKFFTLLGKKTHLDYIEHDMIRGDQGFAEPRIHFALVCASVGCPKLQTRAFTEQRLEEMLESGAKVFLNDGSRNQFSIADKKLRLSKLFDWYGGDFIKQAGSVENYVAQYMVLEANHKSLIRAGNADIAFLDYDWSLNDAGNDARKVK